MMDINARAPFRLMRAAVPALTASRGTIVNVSSVTGLRSFPGVLSYCVSKAGDRPADAVCGARAGAQRRAGQRRQPGRRRVEPPPAGRDGRGDLREVPDALARDPPARPSGRSAEIADLIFFLASDASGWITGETISIDGGRHLTCAR